MELCREWGPDRLPLRIGVVLTVLIFENVTNTSVLGWVSVVLRGMRQRHSLAPHLRRGEASRNGSTHL